MSQYRSKWFIHKSDQSGPQVQITSLLLSWVDSRKKIALLSQNCSFESDLSNEPADQCHIIDVNDSYISLIQFLKFNSHRHFSWDDLRNGSANKSFFWSIQWRVIIAQSFVWMIYLQIKLVHSLNLFSHESFFCVKSFWWISRSIDLNDSFTLYWPDLWFNALIWICNSS